MASTYAKLVTQLVADGNTAWGSGLRADLLRQEGQTRVFDPWCRGALGDLTTDDSAAIQLAIDDAEAAGGGMVGPLGTHKCLSTLTLAANVGLFGLGYGQSRLHFPTDLGAAAYAITYDAAAPGGASAGTLRDFQVTGPGGAFSLGVQTANMDGIRPPTHGTLINVRVSGFRAGFYLNGDHNRLYGCRAEANYYGVLFPTSIISFGSHSFDSCLLNNNNFASVAKAGGGVLDGCHFRACHFGWGPYGLYMADMGSASTTAGCTSTKFDACVFEYCGNAAVLDETTGGGGGADSLVNVTFDRCIYSGSNDTALHRIAARSFAYAVNVRNWRTSDIYEATLPFALPPGGTSVFHVSGITAGVVDHRPPTGHSGTIPTGAEQYVSAGTANFANGITVEVGNYKGHVRTCIGTIAVGDLLGFSSSAGFVTRMTAASPASTFAGTALTAGSNGGTVVVAPPGQEVPVLCETVAGAGLAIRPLAGTEHHGTTAGANPIIGYSSSAGGGGGGALLGVATRSP